MRLLFRNWVSTYKRQMDKEGIRLRFARHQFGRFAVIDSLLLSTFCRPFLKPCAENGQFGLVWGLNHLPCTPRSFTDSSRWWLTPSTPPICPHGLHNLPPNDRDPELLRFLFFTFSLGTFFETTGAKKLTLLLCLFFYMEKRKKHREFTKHSSTFNNSSIFV